MAAILDFWKTRNNPGRSTEEQRSNKIINVLITDRVRLHFSKGLGDNVLKNQATTVIVDHQKEIEQAVAEAEKKAAQESRRTLRKLREQMESEKQNAVKTQKEYYEKLSKRVAEQRDAAEEERARELTNQLKREKELELRRQWEECERAKEQAVQEACTALRNCVAAEFAEEQRRNIDRAVAAEQEAGKQRERESVERTRRECEEMARTEAGRVSDLHQDHVNTLNDRYAELEHRYSKECLQRRKVDHDFKGLQEDYKRFMDYTDGQFHSDYMMKLRNHGMTLANKRD